MSGRDPLARPLEEVENRQFKQINQPIDKEYFYVPHDGCKIPIVPCDPVFHFKSPKHRHMNNKTLILRSLAGLNTLLREPRVAEAVSPEGIWAAFKYLGMCNAERPHWIREAQGLRRIRITYSGCARVLDIFAELSSLADPEPCLDEYPYERFLYLWLRPCGFNEKNEIVLKDPPQGEPNQQDPQFTQRELDDLFLPDRKHDDTDRMDNDDDLYFDPFGDQSRDGYALTRQRAAEEQKRAEERKKAAELAAQHDHKRCFWQFVPVATTTQRLQTLTLPQLAEDGTADLTKVPEYCFEKYRNVLYLGRVVADWRGTNVHIRGNTWRHLVFGPPVTAAEDPDKAMAAYLKTMVEVRPHTRVIHVDATNAN
jgi:hypothetical protein